MAIIEVELERAERVVEDVKVLEEIRDDIESDHPRSVERIEKLQHRRVDELPAVRIRVAAELLGLSPPTIYKWAEHGLLEEVPAPRIRKVTLRSILDVEPHVTKLRELGVTRNLIEAVLSRIDDDETLTDRRLRASIRQFRRGTLVDITPKAGGNRASSIEEEGKPGSK